MKKRLNSTFSDTQVRLVNAKSRKYRLYYVLLFKYYEINDGFFTIIPKFSNNLITRIAQKFDIVRIISQPSAKIVSEYRKEIRTYFQTSAITTEHEELIKTFIAKILPIQNRFDLEILKEQVYSYLAKNKIERISELSLERAIKACIYNYENSLFAEINADIDYVTKAYLDGLLIFEKGHSIMSFIKSWPDGFSLENILTEAEKLRHLSLLKLPVVLDKIPNNQLKRYYRNISTKYPNAIKEMPESNKYAFLAILCFVRKREINDNLVELLIRLVQKVFIAGERKLKKDLSQVVKIKEVYNSRKVLATLVNTVLLNQDKVIKDAIFPVISQKKLEEIKGQLANQTVTYNNLVYERARKSYIHHYRRMLAPVLELLEFHSNNNYYKPIIEALEIIKSNLGSNSTYYPAGLSIPIEGAIKKSHYNFVIDKNNQEERVNRVNYELSVLSNLRSKLRVKEVWIASAYQYRDPEEDLPQDFDNRKEEYYALIDKPLIAKKFTAKIKSLMTKHLHKLNTSLPTNDHVRLLKKPKGQIKLSRLKEQEPPPQLEIIKQEVFNKWPSISLLDILKETDLFVDFLGDFIPSGSKEGLDKPTIKKRLLLAILGYGTNTGLKSMSIGNEEVSYQDLKHIKLRYLDSDNLRNAIRKIINHLLSIQIPEIWSHCTTAVASDSTHFKATDQNLMSRWHPRYRSKGVMVYWHVDTNSICIYSQLKSCASSEVSSMIEGILRHSTDMDIERNYVDTHGASEIGFAFSYMLDFELLPRFKNINVQKLYSVLKADGAAYNNLTSIISRAINWDIIEKYYDQIVKYTVALKQGRVNAENIMRRFTHNNLQHPVYKALSELGKAIKTIFLCRYLTSEALRREIHEGLNVVERWNGVNDFIFYGKTGMLRSNNPAEFELSMLCLHLLQLSMVYINTLMLQQVLISSRWLERMTLEDKRAITPLLSEHINPYGQFPLNMDKRLAIDLPHLRSRVA